jgi:hypothetical protein
MEFPNYFSSFSNTNFNSFTPVAFGENTGSLSKGVSKGGKMAFDPLTLGLAGGSALASLFGANKAADTQAQVANAKMRLGADQLKWQVMLGREQGYGQAAQEMAGRTAQGTWMPDLELGRQLYAKKFQLGPLAEMESATFSDRARRGFALENSLEAREQSQREHRKNLEEKMAGYAAGGRFMFGPIGSVDVNKIFAG